jgi:hypothetical protein
MQSRTLEELAHCARLLALNIGHYQSSYGALPKDEMIELLHADTADGEQAKLLADGMQVLIGVLGAAAHSTSAPDIDDLC